MSDDVYSSLNPKPVAVWFLSSLAFSAYAVATPLFFDGGAYAFFSTSCWGWGWPLVLLSGAYMLFCSTLLIFSIIASPGKALYVKNGKLIFLFRIFWSVEIADIVSVQEQIKPFGARNLVVNLKNGKRKLIWATFLAEPNSALIGKIQAVSVF